MLKINGIDNTGDLNEIDKNKYDETIEEVSEIFRLNINISNYDEEIIFKSLISEFYQRNTNPSIVEYLLKGIYDNISLRG